MEQLFTRDGDLCARGLVAGRFLSRNGPDRVPATRVVQALGHPGPSPEVAADVAQWARAGDVAQRV